MQRHYFMMMGATLVLLLCGACGEDGDTAPESQDMALSIWMAPLDGTCSNAGSVGSLSEIRVKVMDNSVDPPEVVADERFSASGSFKMSVHESEDLELTMLGYTTKGGKNPKIWGRAKSFTVSKDMVTNLKMAANRFMGFSCVKAPDGTANVLFPATVALPDGKVLITGGFARIKKDGDRYEIGDPQATAYIFDPYTGKLSMTKNGMNRARGAHTAVYLPKKNQILVVGGAERLYFQADTKQFPFYYDKQKVGTAGRTYEIYDIAKGKFLEFQDGGSSEWPDGTTNTMTKSISRVFPVAAVNNDGTVLVTGGGLWPSVAGTFETDADYQEAEIYRPQSVNYEGGFLNTEGALTMSAIRTGHAGAVLDPGSKLSHHLFVGGNMEGPIAEIYLESSGQLDGNFGVFKGLEVEEASSFDKKPYFHTLTPLMGRRYLIAGGVNSSGSVLGRPSAGNVYLVKVNEDDSLTVDSVEGMEIGRYMHTAWSYDERHVVVMGGFTSNTDSKKYTSEALSDVRLFDLTTGVMTKLDSDEAAIPRAGMGSIMLNNDCLLLHGGIDVMTGSDSVPLISEVYCPGALCPSGLWDSVCYQE